MKIRREAASKLAAGRGRRREKGGRGRAVRLAEVCLSACCLCTARTTVLPAVDTLSSAVMMSCHNPLHAMLLYQRSSMYSGRLYTSHRSLVETPLADLLAAVE